MSKYLCRTNVNCKVLKNTQNSAQVSVNFSIVILGQVCSILIMYIAVKLQQCTR